MKYIIKIIIFCYFSICYAGTITYGSYPQGDSGFYFSDGQGNSIYMGSSSSVPYIYNNYPSAVWVEATTDRIPANLIVYQYINGYPTYLCRTLQNGEWLYGQLVVNEGCEISDTNQTFTSFQVLVR